MSENNKQPHPKLGEWRTIKAQAERKRYNDNGNRWDRRWVRCEGKRPIVAMFIGVRTVFDSTVEYIDYEAGWQNIFGKPTRVWLFVTGVNRKPIFVLPDDALEPAEARS